MPIELRDGVAVMRRDRFRLIMLDGDREIEAISEQFEALTDLRSQLLDLGYEMHRLESVR